MKGAIQWAWRRSFALFSASLAAIALVSAPVLAGEVYYKWLDERGNPVHSDRPPAKGIKYEVVSTGSSLIRQVEPEEGAVPRKSNPGWAMNSSRLKPRPR